MITSNFQEEIFFSFSYLLAIPREQFFMPTDKYDKAINAPQQPLGRGDQNKIA